METIKLNVGGVITEVDKEEVSKGLEAGELSVNNDEIIAYDKESFETFKKNLADAEYKNGKTAGQEMQIKDAREKLGLEFEGKSFDKFTEAFKNKVLEEAKVEPSKKIEELKADNEKLRGNYTDIENQFNQFKEQVAQKETAQKKDSIFMKSIPQDGLQVDADIALMALKNKSGLDVDFDEGGNIIPMRGGQPVKDEKTLQPVDFETLINYELNTLGLIKKPAGGSGGGDDPGNGGNLSSYEKFEEEMVKQDILPGSLAFSQEMQKRQKNGTLKF